MSDFIAVGLHDGFVHVRYNLGSGEVVIPYNGSRINDHRWHRIHFRRSADDCLRGVVWSCFGNLSYTFSSSSAFSLFGVGVYFVSTSSSVFASSFSVSLSLSPSHPPSPSLSLLSLLSPLTPSPKLHFSSCDGINSHCCRSLITVVAAPTDRWRFNRDRIVTSVAGSLNRHMREGRFSR